MRKFAIMMSLLLCSYHIFGQDKAVTGKVTDDKDGTPLAGVSVTVKGTTIGTSTGADGSFRLSVPSSARVLVFTYVNFASQEVSIGNRSEFSIKLVSEEKALSEVVVVGYGTVRKKDLTGSVSTIGGDKVRDLPVQSFDQALSGRAAGVSITIPNGVVNNPPVIRIRGVNSISLSSFPLVVVDGIASFSGDVGNGNAANNPLGDINPNDIESIDVLKDAAAAAIYGSRASAGVLIITTKKGKQGRARVNYDAWVGFTKPFNLIPVLNGREYETIKNEGLTNAGTPPNGTTRGFYPYIGPDGNPVDTKWYDIIYRTGTSQNHNISVSGANDKTTYYFSAGYTKQEGMIIQNDFTRLNATMNLDHKVNNRITFGGKFQYANSKNTGVNSGSTPGGAFATSGIARLGFNLMPNVPVYLNNGAYNINTVSNTIGQGANLTALQFTNPQVLLDLNTFESVSDRVISNIYANVKIINGLSFRTTFGIDNLNVVNKSFQNALHGDGVANGGSAFNNLQTFRRWNWTNVLNYMESFGNHNITALVGNEQQSTKSDGWGANRQGVTDPFYNEFQGGFNTIVPFGNFLSENYLVSFFGRVNYDYNKKYLLSVNGRRDGYSAFSPENKYGNFWGASAGWVLSEEEFFANSGLSKIFSNLKLRGSYGVVGNNQGINDFAFWSFYNNGLYGSNPALAFAQAGNENLKWETSKKTDIGLELGFLNNRINVEATYYINNVDNLILAEPQAPSRGIPGNSILQNIGSMSNKGVEITIGANVIQKKGFSWNTNFNITTLKNEVTALAAGNADIQPATSGLERPSMIRVGESIGSFYAVRTGGVNPANGQRIFYYRDGTAVQYNHAAPVASRWTLVSTGAVAPRVADQANDGIIVGPALPKWSGGWDNTFRYNGFDLNMLFFFSGGNYVYNGTKAGLRDMRSWNNSKEALTRWTKAGDVTNIPRIVFGDNISNGSGVVMTENIEKGDFLKLRTITLGYSVPKTIADKVGINSFRVYAQVLNAFTLTKYTGYDPEISSNGNGNGNPSVDRNSVPQARSFNIGVNVGF
ncbi:SusC/RagA family TonB-linked outer membrane protein [Lacibacter sediminis]|uniref:TonB-dependent receptor n=1 Tax=Lacibacter sediminis TaxID=2760713 RepID=A0A7G5XF74_9BACT|nr:TonB-dependent receptor [Lacibacter sediminis]QNA44127.1 TonB-dependent receptor [Lacibacter sediminis]